MRTVIKVVASWLWWFLGLWHLFFGSVLGVLDFLAPDAPLGQWARLVGGPAAPFAAFQSPLRTTTTACAHRAVLLTLAMNTGALGLLALLVSYMCYHKRSWLFYFVGVVVVGFAQLSSFIVLVVGQVQPLGAVNVAGMVLWGVAVVITPFGYDTYPSLDEIKDRESGFTRIGGGN
jgi:hypothetical protein